MATYNNRASDYLQMGQYDLAIADYDEAIRIEPDNAILHRARGAAYMGKKDYAHALQDYSEVIRISPSEKIGYERRVMVYMQTADATAAAGDYARIAQIDPKDTVAKYMHAVLNFYGGVAKDSVAELDAMDPKEQVYMPLWSEIVRRRSRMPSRLAAMASSIDPKEWPGTVVGMFQKKVTPEDALVQAQTETKVEDRKIKVCDVVFYGGELALLNGATAKANEAFSKALEECNPGSLEWVAATSEMKKIRS
jgi:lipoprotein NlpI